MSNFAQIIEKTNPGVFHIHIDSTTTSEDLHKRAQGELSFISHDFTGHPDGYEHFEPTAHSSLVLNTKEEFSLIWEQLRFMIEAEGKDFVGYIEGEYIPNDIFIPYKPIKLFFPPPFMVTRRRLSADENFRQTEFHLVLDYDNSDERVIKGLLEIGLYGALLEKKDHTAIVLTMQGFIRDIHPLQAVVEKYLREVGGVVRCTIKEERAIRNQLFNMNVGDLPKIAYEVTYI
ncbi:hypothetical protein COB64_01525 [Candidatus Wolfebacteria bacterium]|nr:MAG: hypothetical protein COB64_01525 [Candidatus Wolfebacteria bacterium]